MANPFAHLRQKPRVLSTAAPLTVKNLSDQNRCPQTTCWHLKLKLCCHHLESLSHWTSTPIKGGEESKPCYSTLAILAERILRPTPMDPSQEIDERRRRRTCLRQWIPKKPMALSSCHESISQQRLTCQKSEDYATRDGEKKFYERPVNKFVRLLAKEDIEKWTDSQWFGFINSISFISNQQLLYFYITSCNSVFRLFGKWRNI